MRYRVRGWVRSRLKGSRKYCGAAIVSLVDNFVVEGGAVVTREDIDVLLGESDDRAGAEDKNESVAP